MSNSVPVSVIYDLVTKWTAEQKDAPAETAHSAYKLSGYIIARCRRMWLPQLLHKISRLTRQAWPPVRQGHRAFGQSALPVVYDATFFSLFKTAMLHRAERPKPSKAFSKTTDWRKERAGKPSYKASPMCSSVHDPCSQTANLVDDDEPDSTLEPCQNPVQLLETEGVCTDGQNAHLPKERKKERKVSIADSLDPGCSGDQNEWLSLGLSGSGTESCMMI
ncbi:hypothetical protein V8C44DRAFT_316286 [Trichoderma aethiopicum]